MFSLITKIEVRARYVDNGLEDWQESQREGRFHSVGKETRNPISNTILSMKRFYSERGCISNLT
jgi:hypothetical protein